MFCSSCNGECPSTANICDQCGQHQCSQVSNKAAGSVDKGKLLKEYFHRGYLYAVIVSLLEKRHRVRIHLRMLKRKLKNRPPKLKDLFALFSLNFYLNHMPFIHYLEFYLPM